MDALAPFRIPLATLKADEASYVWELGPDFLALFDDEHEPLPARFKVGMELVRTGGVITLDFQVEGGLQTLCDRCLAPVDLTFSADYQIIVKFGSPGQSTDEVIFIDPDAPDLNIGSLIYDFALLSIPVSHRIPGCESLDPSPCDQSVLSYLKENPPVFPPDEGDSPWTQLRKVIDN